MEVGIVVIIVWYVLNIVWLIFGFTKVKSFHYNNCTPKTKFTIIVPFRNEAENLPKLLHSISKLNYPTDFFEVILVDDESDEEYEVQNTIYKILLLQNNRKTNSPKKDAINTAIIQAKNDWIITTDADCLVPIHWLTIFDAFIQQNNPKMIASGVYYSTSHSVLDNFQQLDLLSLQGTTIGSFGNRQAFMCNGANFAYTKDFFAELKGFEGNDTIASGDDVFLLQKAIQREGEKVAFLKSNDVFVQTQTESSWPDLFNQRIRWASKTGNYSGIYSKQLGLSVLLMNVLVVFAIFAFLLSFQFSGILLIVIKMLVDFVLLFQTSRLFKLKLPYFILNTFIYPFFSTSVALFSFFGKYTWKGRKFKM